MIDMADQQDAKVADPGIDEAIARLTPDEISTVINRVLNKESAARMKVYLQTCVHCALCSDACHTYLSRDKDPNFAPVAKVKDTIWYMIKKKGRVDGEFLKQAARIASPGKPVRYARVSA